ncbi:uncharacterized protein LOC113304154 [Papaver somniferum]|uniref:uncharacterized protein LOC113304154 n=1 Tax=Papaver somniferum TaxID=3469 RepID=UPI000E6F82B7|nr:uncharacterized protein LOC113304154 [Papaver somniferum]
MEASPTSKNISISMDVCLTFCRPETSYIMLFKMGIIIVHCVLKPLKHPLTVFFTTTFLEQYGLQFLAYIYIMMLFWWNGSPAGLINSQLIRSNKCNLEIDLLQQKPTSLPIQVPRQSRANLRRSPPPLDTLKINVDGSFNYDNKTGGIGLIVRDFAGAQRRSKCIYLEAAWSPEHVESKGLWEAVKWAEEMQLVNVQFEMDSQIVADAVNKNSTTVDWKIRNLLLDIKSVFSNYSSWKCSYVPKEKNKVADILAKYARVSRVSSVWLLSIPEIIHNQIQEDANIVNSEV